MSTELAPTDRHPQQRSSLALLLGLMAALTLCGGCQRQAAAPAAKPEEAKQEAKHDDLQKAIEAPINKAKAVEQPLLDSADKVDEAMDEQDKASSDGN